MRRASGVVRSPFVTSFDCITFMTDYGLEDGFVAACHGVAAGIAPATRVIDITHLVQPGDVRRGAAVLAQTIPYLPPAVHVAVVDPGVGTARRAVAVKAGDSVLLQGTGGVSIFGLQFAHAMGIAAIITSSSDEKLQRAKALGAAHGINYKTTPDWEKAAVEFTGGRGVDHVVEVGGAATLTRSFGAIRVGGKITLIGGLSGGASELNPGLIFSRRANVQGISVGSTQMFMAMNRAIEANAIKPVIDRVFGFAEAQAAYRHLASGAHFGKIVIRID